MISIQKQLQGDLTNHDLQSKEAEARKKYLELNQARMAFLHEKVKCEWLKEGDSNTAYFHACLKKRRAQFIYTGLEIPLAHGWRIKNLWRRLLWIFMLVCLALHKESRRKVSRSVLNKGRRLNSIQQDMLLQPFCIDDVKKALFNIDDIKARGLMAIQAVFTRSHGAF